MPFSAESKTGVVVNSARICVPVCARTTGEMQQVINHVRQFADGIELRLDCLKDEELYRIAPVIDAVIQKVEKPVILTLRSAAQGGENSLTDSKRLAFWLKYLAPEKHGAMFVDIELDSALLFLGWEREGKLKLDWSRVICSRHDFETVLAENFETIYERMTKTPARVLKIAFPAREATDCLPAFKTLQHAQSEGRTLIPIAMGDAGIPTRVLGPSRGAFLTFGSLDKNNKTAPGQATAEELRDEYRIRNINKQTEIFGVVGSRVANSVSPRIFNAAFAALNINAVYLPFEVQSVKDFIRRMVRPETRELDWNLRGLSITAPHKSGVIGELDWVEDLAQKAGSVNTVVIERGIMRGYNAAPATRLKTQAISGECEISREIGFLVAEAAEQLRLWTGKEPSLEVMKTAARLALEEQTAICITE